MILDELRKELDSIYCNIDRDVDDIVRSLKRLGEVVVDLEKLTEERKGEDDDK